MEQRFLVGGHLVRPFVQTSAVQCRGCSRPLERRITDFGADDSFEKASKKLKEHYGITIPVSATRTTTLKHAKTMKDMENLKFELPEQSEVQCVIAQMDGSMIPIVDTDDNTTSEQCVDLRKTRKVRWKEARLALAHAEECVSPTFGVTLGDPDSAGDQLGHCAIQAGAGETTKVHCVGDGAAWIADQVDRIFGTSGSYLVDFYHLCEYVADASKCCAPDNPKGWMEQQKRLLKESQVTDFLEGMAPFIEAESVPDKDAPVRKCSRYIRNRPGQFDYKKTLEMNLPIGSGEIESAHRYVIQDRLKISGAWWKETNAEYMLSLRTWRANNNWDNYWSKNQNIGQQRN